MDHQTQEKNKQIVRDFIEKVVNTGDTSKISHFISEDYIENYGGQKYRLGIKGVIEHIRGVRNTYPDLTLKIERQICEGNWVATVYTMTGTHQGEWNGIRPTHKKLSVTGVNTDRVEKGKIVEHGGAANMLEPLLEAGAIKKC